MKAIFTAQQMAEADRFTVESEDIEGLDLMERAAQACFDSLRPRILSGDFVAVIAGCGNNGGDGFALARLLAEDGVHVAVWLLFEPEKISGDALVNFQRLGDLDVDIFGIESPWRPPAEAAWFVDAMFGTGLNRPLEGLPAEVAKWLNRHPAKIFSVDLPSGLSGNTGKLIGPCVSADITITFQHLKLAHAVAPACTHCGQVLIRDIGVHAADSTVLAHYLIEAEDFQRPTRPPNSHKGSFGTLAVIGGFAGMEGAANLSSVAALRFGAGKVMIMTDAGGARFHHDSVMISPIDQIQDLVGYDAAVIGPGMGRGEEQFAHLDRLNLDRLGVVWDADGLYYAAKKGVRGAVTVLTPHPGEAAMLLNCKAADVQSDRLEALAMLHERFPESWLVLKGYRTLIGSPEGEVFVAATGNPALSTAGSGDVLAGMIGALLANGYTADDAVMLSVVRHGMAADRWLEQHPDYAMLAEDIIADLTY